MTGIADLVDRAVALPPGPELSAVLAGLPCAKVPNTRLVEILQARSRQLAHDQAELHATMVEISHATAVADLPGNRAETVVRTGEHVESAGHEIAAGLTWTPAYADRELGFALALVERLPLVFAALRQGLIDRGKAWVFADYLDPTTGDLTEEQSRRLCEQFVPLAPGLTTKQLADRLYRALHAIDPELRRRRYRRAVQGRGVALYLDPRTGTATLLGSGLPPAEAAAAAERLDRLVEKAKRAGHPGRRAQISADLYLGMLNGAFHGLNEDEIIARLLAMPRTEDRLDINRNSDLDTPDDDADATSADSTADRAVDDSPPDPADDSGTHTGADDDQPADAERTPASPADPQGDRWAGDRVATREGIEIRVGLATLAGLDDRPGEIPGLGPVGADIARDTVAGQRRGASWKFAIVDSHGYLLLAGPIRRRPRTHRDTRPGTGRVRGGVVEVLLSLDELQRYAADPTLAEWHGMLAEIADAWDHRDEIRRRLAAQPGARFARGPLADHVRARDRYCCGPGCTRSARHSDLDHTLDHARGGRTVRSTSARPAISTIPTKIAAGVSASPSRGCSGGSARSGASTSHGASRSGPTSRIPNRPSTRTGRPTERPTPRPSSASAATTHKSWSGPRSRRPGRLRNRIRLPMTSRRSSGRRVGAPTACAHPRRWRSRDRYEPGRLPSEPEPKRPAVEPMWHFHRTDHDGAGRIGSSEGGQLPRPHARCVHPAGGARARVAGRRPGSPPSARPGVALGGSGRFRGRTRWPRGLLHERVHRVAARNLLERPPPTAARDPAVRGRPTYGSRPSTAVIAAWRAGNSRMPMPPPEIRTARVGTTAPGDALAELHASARSSRSATGCSCPPGRSLREQIGEACPIASFLPFGSRHAVARVAFAAISRSTRGKDCWWMH